MHESNLAQPLAAKLAGKGLITEHSRPPLELVRKEGSARSRLAIRRKSLRQIVMDDGNFRPFRVF